MHERRRWAGCFRFLATVAAGSALAGAPLGCGDDESAGSGGGDDAAPQATVDVQVGAPGVFVREVAIYQGVRRSLMVDGTVVDGTVPIIAGRAAVLRVFHQVTRDYDGQEVTGRLTFPDGEILEVTRRLGPQSVESDLISTFVFDIPAERLVPGTLDVAIELVQTRTVPADQADVPQESPARWSTAGAIEVRGDGAPLRVRLVPFRYQADGLGRMPDTSAAAIEAYRSRIASLFPVSDVEVTVREPVAWEATISPEGGGWGEILDALYDLRGRDAPGDDVYYYGIFNPDDDFHGYCRQGCVLGLTYLNSQQFGNGSVDLQMALGIGYVDVAPDTAAHELGHSMGREHAPCGGPDSVDPKYPHQGGSIGVWGMEAVTHVQHSPAETDFMGYCNDVWVSDYTWSAIFSRLEGGTLEKRLGRAEPRPALRVRLDGEGRVTSHAFTRVDPRAAGGRTATATLTGRDGVRRTAEAHVLGYDHIEGSTVLVPDVDASTRRVELVIDGQPLILSL